MEIVRVSKGEEERVVRQFVRALKEGKVVACPTDTVYGLLADATSKKAVERVFEIKGRAKDKALPVFVKDVQMAKRLAKIKKSQEDFLQKSWPGKITAVLESKHKLPKELELDDKIALRIPNYELVNLILKKLKRPITGTSANISGKPPCSSATEVVAQFRKRKHQVDLLLDAGVLSKSKPSKVIDITGRTSRVLRK